MKIRFADLSWPIKVPLVALWIYIGLMALAFLVGFVQEMAAPTI